MKTDLNETLSYGRDCDILEVDQWSSMGAGEQFCSPGNIWPCPEMLSVITTGRGLLPASSG